MAARLLIYDRTCGAGPSGAFGLTTAWRAGAGLYRGLGRLDDGRGIASWEDAFAWLEARRITGNPQYTRLLIVYLLALIVIGAINQTGLLALYWLVGIAHAFFQNRTVKAQAIARLASRQH